MPERSFDMPVGPLRMEAILMMAKKWVNGTKLKYSFFEGDSFFTPATDSNGNHTKLYWKGTEEEKEAVRKAFYTWKSLGIGLEFEETDDHLEALIRIGFAKGEGSWSYVGRDAWDIPKEERTMNFGWDIVNDQDTILHEIGHAMASPTNTRTPRRGSFGTRRRSIRPWQALPTSGPAIRPFITLLEKSHPTRYRARVGIPILLCTILLGHI